MKTSFVPNAPGSSEETERPNAATNVAAAIRKESALAQLVPESALLKLLDAADGNSPAEGEADELARLISGAEDLQRLGAGQAACYYSSLYMTGEYAQILFHKLESPLSLIAETVRHHSRTCQRPVPLGLFALPPFSLILEHLLHHLDTMASTAEYADIRSTTTSADGLYLYSSTYLEVDHAGMLAEWLDVGQSENP